MSKNLLYSGFPGYCQGELARASRPDSHLFHHGCPVFEVHTHNCRITSLAVSSAGNFVATGDEHGLVKVSYIFPFQADVKKVRSGHVNDAMKKQTPGPMFSKKWDADVECHEGTVFAINFLTRSYGSANNRVLIMATGSNDRVVRLWKVVLTKEEISVTAHMLLSTMSSTVLCINSVCMPSDYPTADDICDTEYSSAMSSNKLRSYHGITAILTAGTSTGAVYLWKLTIEDLYRADLGENENVHHTIRGHWNECPRDDGHRLKSLVFASENSIVHIAPTITARTKEINRHGESPTKKIKSVYIKKIDQFTTDTHKHGRVAVAISDTSGKVKYYEETGEENSGIDYNDDCCDYSRTDDKEDRLTVAAVVFKGEDQFQSPIVACTFRPTYEVGCEVLLEDDDHSTEKITAVHNLLLVVTTDGNLALKHTDDFGAKTVHDMEVFSSLLMI